MVKKNDNKTIYDIFPIDQTESKGEYFFQSLIWAKIKSDFGWQAVFFRQLRSAHITQDILILIKKIPFLGHLLYIPDGLIKSSIGETHIDGILHIQFIQDAVDILFDITSLITQIYGKTVISLRWDMPWRQLYSSKDNKILQGSKVETKVYDNFKNTVCKIKNKKGIIKNTACVQPSATSILDLHASEKELLAGMKSKTRYNIGLAKKKGISIQCDVSLDVFYDLYLKTSQRNNITIHSKEYYQKVIFYITSNKDKNCESDIKIYGALYEGEIIASIIVLYYTNPYNKKDKIALYLYGASSHEHRNTMPAYALQWQAIIDAKKLSCTQYDFFGIPLLYDVQNGKTKQQNLKNISMKGLYQFKTGFGGNSYVRPACIECVPKGTFLIYWKNALFCLAEKVRSWYFLKIKKR